MAMAVEATEVAVAMDVADTARGRLRPPLRPAMAMAVEATVVAVAMDVADTARGRLRLRPAMVTAVEVTEAAAMDVADMARGPLMPSLRPTLSSTEDTTATPLPSPMPAMPMPPPTLTPTGMLPPTLMALLAMLLP